MTRGAVGGSDEVTMSFLGRTVIATCAHPGISVGDQVAVIEQPQGCYWATTQQKSWYRRSLKDLIAQGKPVTAALEYLLGKFGRVWKPEVQITLNSTWTLRITSTPLFPTWVFFKQRIDGVERPSALTGDIPERLQMLVPGYFGEDPAIVTDDGGEETRTYTGTASATLVSFIIVPYRYVIHNRESGAVFDWYPSEAFVDAFDTGAVGISFDGGEEFTAEFSTRTIEIIPADAGDISTMSECEFAEYAI